MLRIIVMALVMLCCGVAVADDYTESGGYFWQGDKAYTRTQVKYKRYTHTRGNCRYYVWDTKWEYTFHHEREKPAPVVVTPDKEPDEGYTGTQRLKSELIALAADRHKWQHKLETSQQENKELLELIDALGLKGYAEVNQVYQQTNPGAYKLTSKFNTTQGPFAEQGNTLYGYNAFAPRYSEVDIQVGFTQQAELAKNCSLWQARRPAISRHCSLNRCRSTVSWTISRSPPSSWSEC